MRSIDPRGSASIFSPETVRRLQLCSPSFFQHPTTFCSGASGVSDSCKIISRSRGAILGTLENEPSKQGRLKYGNMMGTYKLKKEIPTGSKLNSTVNKLSKRIQSLVGEKKEQGEKLSKKDTMKKLNFSEACETDVSMPPRNITCNINSTMNSRNAKCISLQTSEGLTTAYANNYRRTPSSNGSSSKAIRPPSTFMKRDLRKYSQQNNTKFYLETEEDSPDTLQSQPTEENNSVLLNNTRVKKFHKQSKCSDKFEITTKVPIQALLRPITTKNRCYKQTVKDKPQVGVKLKTACVKKEDKCTIF